MREFTKGITYTQLITFKAIYEAGNISKAAKHLALSSATVSHSLKLLEQQITQPLFTRTTRAFKPTELGTHMYQSIKGKVEDLTLAVERVCLQNDVPNGKLTLNMAKNIYDVFLKEILGDFQCAFPSIELEVTLSDFMDDRVEQSIDIGFRFGETVSDTMIARPIGNRLKPVKLALFASPEYLQKYGYPETISDLEKLAFIKFRAPTSGDLFPIRLYQSLGSRSEILSLPNLSTAVIVNNTDVMLDMACKGVGVGTMIDAMVQPQFDSGALVPVLEQLWCDTPEVYMYYAPENRQTLRIRCFLDFINERLETHI